MRRRFYLADNLGAGHGSRRLIEQVIAALTLHGAAVVRERHASTAEALAAMEKAARGGHHDALLAAGGDGTIRLAAKAALGTGMPIGVIPRGTGNVLAHETGLPQQPIAIADLLLHGGVRTINAGRVNGELFLLMVGVGFDGRVIAALDQRLKRLLGKAAYVPATVRALAHGAETLDVTCDGGWTDHVTWAVICNARRYGGRFEMAPNARVETSGFEAILFEGTGRRQRIGQLWALARGRLMSERLHMQGYGGDVIMRGCRSATIRSTTPVPVQVDGDRFGTTPVTIEDAGPCVRLIVPPRDY